jgi:hypothetical protein
MPSSPPPVGLPDVSALAVGFQVLSLIASNVLVVEALYVYAKKRAIRNGPKLQLQPIYKV